MSRHSDGTLLRMRQQYEREYAWAPDYPAAELEAVRGGIIDQDAAAVRAEAEAAAARQRGDEDLAARHEQIAASSRAAAAFYRERAAEGEAVMADRQEWDRLTEGTRNLAVRADAEYRRRYPEAELQPLSAGEAEQPGRCGGGRAARAARRSRGDPADGPHGPQPGNGSGPKQRPGRTSWCLTRTRTWNPSARRGQHAKPGHGTRSSSRPSRKSGRPRASWKRSPHGRPNRKPRWKPGSDRPPAHTKWCEAQRKDGYA